MIHNSSIAAEPLSEAVSKTLDNTTRLLTLMLALQGMRPENDPPTALRVDSQLPDEGFVRLETVLTLFPVSKSTWWNGVQSGRFPAPVRSGRITMWSVKSLRTLVQQLEQEGVQS